MTVAAATITMLLTVAELMQHTTLAARRKTTVLPMTVDPRITVAAAVRTTAALVPTIAVAKMRLATNVVATPPQLPRPPTNNPPKPPYTMLEAKHPLQNRPNPLTPATMVESTTMRMVPPMLRITRSPPRHTLM